MGGKLTDELSLLPEQVTSLSESRIAIICAQWNKEICEKLLSGARAVFEKYNIAFIVFYVPGSFELIHAASMLCKTNEFHSIVCLGCVIKGDTDHDVFINQAISQSLGQLNIQYSIPVILGVLTVKNISQAQERAGGKIGNKGTEAAIAAIQMILMNKSISNKNG
jgi:6,7-dimethyl-8-ribityllumazine synthase